MAMTIGSVTVDANGTATGSGMALDLYNAVIPLSAAALASAPQQTKATFRQSTADFCAALAAGIVNHIHANAVVDLSAVVATVGTGASVGRTPNPNNANTAIQGPSAAVTLPVTNGVATTIGIT